ncbi:hypothetical protein [Flagellimonas sp.]|uniref:hypothetical protein n=1 Tax=Flagellimonas sp. TaxID=2058762 RepID=UPI003B5C3017
MKTVLLFLTIIFSSIALMSCTNDEGDNDLDFITPNEEEESVLSISETEGED